MESARVEAIEGEIDRIIERKEANAVEELWKNSTRLCNERRRRENGAARREHHLRMREVHARLAEEHENAALSLLRTGGDTT